RSCWSFLACSACCSPHDRRTDAKPRSRYHIQLMDGLIGQSDGVIRFAVFLSVFLLMALIELLWPKRKLIASKKRRWLTNVGISVAASADRKSTRLNSSH